MRYDDREFNVNFLSPSRRSVMKKGQRGLKMKRTKTSMGKPPLTVSPVGGKPYTCGQMLRTNKGALKSGDGSGKAAYPMASG